MTDQTTAPATTTCDFPACVHPDHVRVGCPNEGQREDFTAVSPQIVRPEDDPVWRRTVLDAAAFQRQYPTPAYLAEFATQLAALAFARGMRWQQQSPDARAVPPTPARIVAEVMDHAARHPDDGRMAAVRAFAHASQREHAVARPAAPAVEDGGNCGG